MRGLVRRRKHCICRQVEGWQLRPQGRWQYLLHECVKRPALAWKHALLCLLLFDRLPTGRVHICRPSEKFESECRCNHPILATYAQHRHGVCSADYLAADLMFHPPSPRLGCRIHRLLRDILPISLYVFLLFVQHDEKKPGPRRYPVGSIEARELHLEPHLSAPWVCFH